MSRSELIWFVVLLLAPLPASASPITWGFTATVDFTEGAPPVALLDSVSGTFTLETSVTPEPPFVGPGFIWEEYLGAFTMADLTVGTDHIVMSSAGAATSLVRMTDFHDALTYSMTGFLVGPGGATVNGDAENVGLSFGLTDRTYTAGTAFPTGLFTPYDPQSPFNVTLRDEIDQIVYSVQASFDSIFLIPEPSTAWLMALGLVAGAGSRPSTKRDDRPQDEKVHPPATGPRRGWT